VGTAASCVYIFVPVTRRIQKRNPRSDRRHHLMQGTGTPTWMSHPPNRMLPSRECSRRTRPGSLFHLISPDKSGQNGRTKSKSKSKNPVDVVYHIRLDPRVIMLGCVARDTSGFRSGSVQVVQPKREAPARATANGRRVFEDPARSLLPVCPMTCQGPTRQQRIPCGLMDSLIRTG
jgi:hypothetical protein